MVFFYLHILMNIAEKFVDKVKSIAFFKPFLQLKMDFIHKGLGNVTPLTTLTPQRGGAAENSTEEEELKNKT